MKHAILVGFLTCAIVGLHDSTAFAARYVPLEIIVNGEVVLKGNASDGGERDADEIWEAMKVSKLYETEAFKKLNIGADVQEYRIELPPPKKGERWPVKIDASYGGEAETRFVTIKRAATDAKGNAWHISSEDLDREFDTRSISRSEAQRLKNPKYDKLTERVKAKGK